MKKFRTMTLLLPVLCVFLLSGLISGQTQEEMMKKWQEFATPGDQHKLLSKMAGEWDMAGRSWTKPGAGPTPLNATASGRMILGGRYIEVTHTGSYLGMPFKGIGITGFDNYKKHYVSVWFDNMGTGMFHSSGTLDKTKKILTEFGVMDDIITGKKIKAKSVTTFKDCDHYVMEMFNVNEDGTLFRTMEAVYTRKKN